MPRIMWKGFHLCFPSNLTKLSSSPSSDAPSDDPNRPSILLINNFNLLYNDSAAAAADHRLSKHLVEAIPYSTTASTSSAAANSSSSSSSSASYDGYDSYGFAPGNDSPPPDLTAVYASRRFFFSSPGRSNSITDSPDLRDNYDNATPPPPPTTTTKLLTGGAAVKTYVDSPDPYNDFRRSMQEMLDDAVSNVGDLRRYEFLHELLLSYLSLNEADNHKFIIKAFTDILVSLLSDGHRIIM